MSVYKICVSSKRKKEIIDITGEIQRLVKKSKIDSGICVIVVEHTTCSLATMDLDKGTDLDFLDAIEKMFPKGNYRHPHNPSHVGDHIMSSIIGQSLIMLIENGKLILGTWQRAVLIELKGPRERIISLKKIRSS